MDSRQALRIAAGLGPYFTWDPWDGAADWQPLTTLSDPEVLAERVAIARQALLRMSGLPPEAIPERVVASIVYLGLASRLLSPLLAAASIASALPAPTPESMWWRPAESGPIPIAVRDQPAPGCAERDAETIADDINRSAVHGLVEPVLTAVRARFAVSPQVLWGNVASALGGAASMIADAAPGADAAPDAAPGAAPGADAAPDADAAPGADADAAPAPVPTSTPGSGSAPGSASASAPGSGSAPGSAPGSGSAPVAVPLPTPGLVPAARSAAIVEAMLRLPPLAGTARLIRPDPSRNRWFLVRRNCCLYYRIPGGGYCGDCVLTPDRVRRQQWQSVLSR